MIVLGLTTPNETPEFTFFFYMSLLLFRIFSKVMAILTCIYACINNLKLCHFINVSPNHFYYFENAVFSEMKNRNYEIVYLGIPIFNNFLVIYVNMNIYHPM